MIRRPPNSTLFPYPPLFRSLVGAVIDHRPAARIAPDALLGARVRDVQPAPAASAAQQPRQQRFAFARGPATHARSEEHTSELQSRLHLVCRLLLEKKKNYRL